MATLRERPSSSLGDIAVGAGVARSTLHRYFADREALLAAIEALVEEEYEAALTQARVDEGAALDAFGRLLDQLLLRLEVLAWWLRDNSDDEDGPDSRIGGLVARGHADGSIDAGLDGAWVEALVWAGLWAANDLVATGARTVRDARKLCRHSLVKAVRS